MCGGGTRRGWAAGTARAGLGSRTPCWWTCGSGYAVRSGRIGSSRWRWRRAGRRGCWGRGGGWGPPPCTTAVTTMDTVTLIRAAIRGLLRVVDADLAVWLRALLASGDDYTSTAKPVIDW